MATRRQIIRTTTLLAAKSEPDQPTVAVTELPPEEPAEVLEDAAEVEVEAEPRPAKLRHAQQPADGPAAPTSAAAKARRGRPPGSTNGAKRAPKLAPKLAPTTSELEAIGALAVAAASANVTLSEYVAELREKLAAYDKVFG